MTIRPATPDDAYIVWQFILGLAEFERLLDSVDGSEAQVREHITDGSCRVILVEEENKPVAFALYFLNYSTFRTRPGIWLEDLYVIPECRGRGIGTMLLNHLKALGVEKGYGRLEWSVLDWNEKAIRTYEKFGATVLPDWKICRVTL